MAGSLVDWQIQDAISSGKIKIDPYEPELIQPNSLDIRLAREFRSYIPNGDIIDLHDRDSIERDTVFEVCESKILYPGQSVLGSTLERIHLPSDIFAELAGRSSVARTFVAIHVCAGVVDAGFEGNLTLEMVNLGSRPVKLYAFEPIAQLIFTQTEKKCDKPYGVKKGSRYQNQGHAELSKIWQQ